MEFLIGILRLWMSWKIKKLEHCVVDTFAQVNTDSKTDFLSLVYFMIIVD